MWRMGDTSPTHWRPMQEESKDALIDRLQDQIHKLKVHNRSMRDLLKNTLSLINETKLPELAESIESLLEELM
jgi:hypothetical protein